MDGKSADKISKAVKSFSTGTVINMIENCDSKLEGTEPKFKALFVELYRLKKVMTVANTLLKNATGTTTNTCMIVSSESQGRKTFCWKFPERGVAGGRKTGSGL